MKSLKRKLNSTSTLDLHLIWVSLWEKNCIEFKYRKAINQMIYDKGNSLTLPKKTSETG